MDLGTIIVGAICAALCIIPFVLMNRNRKKGEQKVLLSLKNSASQHNSALSDYELKGHYAIGLDQTNKFVYFYQQAKGVIKEQFIDLSEIESCKTVNTHRVVQHHNSEQTIVERLDLAFTPRDRSKQVINFEFFNALNSPQLNGELQSIEKWSKTISSLI